LPLGVFLRLPMTRLPILHDASRSLSPAQIVQQYYAVQSVASSRKQCWTNMPLHEACSHLRFSPHCICPVASDDRRLHDVTQPTYPCDELGIHAGSTTL
jgi:hypothetical protein